MDFLFTREACAPYWCDYDDLLLLEDHTVAYRQGSTYRVVPSKNLAFALVL